jgi:hypothetical protein
MKQDDQIVTKRSQLQLVHSYLAHIDVSTELKANVKACFHARLKDASFSSVRDEDIAASMPIALQIEVSKHTNRTLVGEAPLLRGCSDAFMDRLSSLLRERTLEPETQLFREGDVCKELFLVESGFIELTSSAGGLSVGSSGSGSGGGGGGDQGHLGGEQQDEQLVVSVTGETVGELSFIFGIRHFRNGRTASGVETRVFVLTTDNYRVLLKTLPQQEDRVMDNAMFQFDGAWLQSLPSLARGERSLACAAMPLPPACFEGLSLSLALSFSLSLSFSLACAHSARAGAPSSGRAHGPSRARAPPQSSALLSSRSAARAAQVCSPVARRVPKSRRARPCPRGSTSQRALRLARWCLERADRRRRRRMSMPSRGCVASSAQAVPTVCARAARVDAKHSSIFLNLI